MAAIAQFERALIGDRIRSGLARSRALGKTSGRRGAAGATGTARARQHGRENRGAARQKLQLAQSLLQALAPVAERLVDRLPRRGTRRCKMARREADRARRLSSSSASA